MSELTKQHMEWQQLVTANDRLRDSIRRHRDELNQLKEAEKKLSDTNSAIDVCIMRLERKAAKVSTSGRGERDPQIEISDKTSELRRELKLAHAKFLESKIAASKLRDTFDGEMLNRTVHLESAIRTARVETKILEEEIKVLNQLQASQEEEINHFKPLADASKESEHSLYASNHSIREHIRQLMAKRVDLNLKSKVQHRKSVDLLRECRRLEMAQKQANIKK